MNIAAALKAEINRLSNKSIRAQTKATRGLVAHHRHAIAELRRQVAELCKEVASLKRGLKRGALTPLAETRGRKRFVAKGFKAWRTRSGLSAEGIARLVGVTAQTKYNWEAKTSVPKPSLVAKLGAMREMGLRSLRAEIDGSRSGHSVERKVAGRPNARRKTKNSKQSAS